MEEDPTDTATDTMSNASDLSALNLGISVWGANQEFLEQQALNELDIFAKQDDLEEGEIVETQEEERQRKMPASLLNMENYMKSQENLQKRQNSKRELEKKELESVNKQPATKKQKPLKNDDKDVENKKNEGKEDSDSEYLPSEGEEIDSDYETVLKPVEKNLKRKANVHVNKIQDDGLMESYQTRLKEYYKRIEQNLSEEATNKLGYHELKGGLKVDLEIWNKLYSYQQEGVKWLWKLHKKAIGGILGDEMGLGKTVQVIAFLHSLEHSRTVSCHGRFNGLGPSLIVCPATVIHQWVQHFHNWASEFRVAVLHQSGSFHGNKSHLIKDIHKTKGVLITTYNGILKYKSDFCDYNWHYFILDEGHKIRNPTAKVTVAAKNIRTPHRLMLTGSPMQNNLVELWSLFDFTNPGMLGNLSTFQEHFSNPILSGGFANSTPMQEATALSVATTLKDLISPVLLRRTKSEVQEHIALPDKSEQVLFCSLTKEQKDIYKDYLMSEEVNVILGRGVKNWWSEGQMRAKVLVAITQLRKICNHPDIFLYEKDEQLSPSDDTMGYYKKSGKMIVVSALLKIWKKQKHRVLLFTQGRSMITVFQNFLEQQGYKYLKMDGSTSISSRQPLIDKFNKDSSYDVFLLTTRVGGLGINLTGADRVIIYDPDWNPATDTQARERAWRIGQDKQVTIYRLLSAGTIEEKMYQRQVWKQLLSNKILLDPKTSRFFKSSDLHDLFSLQESESNPETANIFHDSRVRIQENMRKKKKKSTKSTHSEESPPGPSSDFQFSEDKIQAMKHLAQQIAKSMTQKKTSLQVELEDERQQKLLEKEQLKTLTPEGLLQYNRDKLNPSDDSSVNKIDDSEAKVGFSEALQYAETTSKLHHMLNHAEPVKIVEKVREVRKKVTKETTEDPLGKYERRKKSKDKKQKIKVDTSGVVDGERVSGLVKREVRKLKKENYRQDVGGESQDDFVLGKLFQKKGISSALQHESVVQGSSAGGNLRIHTEARLRAEKSLEALRKSRIDGWRW